MSEPIPESIPASAERRHRGEPPAKRRALSPKSKHATQLEALFAKPDRDIKIPSGPVQKELAPPPEIVTNVQGSSAGAGSGEFHVYKASRRREAERLRAMDEEVEKRKADEEWEARRERLRQEDEKKLNKNRAKRAKQKERKQKAKQFAKNGTNAPQPNGDKKAEDTENQIGDDTAPSLSQKEVANGAEAATNSADEEDAGFTDNGIIINET